MRFFWSTQAKAWARFPRPFGPTLRVYSAKALRADCAGLFCQDRSGRLCGPILPRPFGPTVRAYSAKALRADYAGLSPKAVRAH